MDLKEYTFLGPHEAVLGIIAINEWDARKCLGQFLRGRGDYCDGWYLLCEVEITFPIVSHKHFPSGESETLVAGSHLLGGEHE